MTHEILVDSREMPMFNAINRGSTYHNPNVHPTYRRNRTVITLCGSTRFIEQFRQANKVLTLADYIVLSIGCDTRTDKELQLNEKTKLQLDNLHFDKIDLSDEILVLNVGGYVGSSTKRELAYAYNSGKIVRFIENVTGQQFFKLLEDAGDVKRTEV